MMRGECGSLWGVPSSKRQVKPQIWEESTAKRYAEVDY